MIATGLLSYVYFLLVCIGLSSYWRVQLMLIKEPIGFGSLVVKQLIFFLASAAVVIGMQFLNYHRLKDWGNIIYGITLLMLIAVMAVGTSALGLNGGFNWDLLPFSHRNFLNY